MSVPEDKKTRLSDLAFERAKESVHDIMKLRVKMARDGTLLKAVDEHFVQAAARLSAMVVAYDTPTGILFMLQIGNTYRPLLNEAFNEGGAEILALEAEEFANGARPQDI